MKHEMAFSDNGMISTSYALVDEAGLNETIGIDDVSSACDYQMMIFRLLLDLCRRPVNGMRCALQKYSRHIGAKNSAWIANGGVSGSSFLFRSR